MRARFPALLVAFAALFAASRAALAHPMGNFSVNQYSKIELRSDRIVIRYFIDLAEIPAFQELQQRNISASASDAAAQRFIAKRGEELATGLYLTIGNVRVPLRMTGNGVIFPPGAGGLPTMKMAFVYEAAVPAGVDRSRVQLHYVDRNYEGHVGWKEIVAVAGTGRVLRSSVPATDRSEELNNYPTDMLNSPPQDLEATLEASLPLPALAPQSVRALKAKAAPVIHSGVRVKRDGENAAAAARQQQPTKALPNSLAHARIELAANRQQTPRGPFTELIAAQHLSVWFLVTAAIIAVGLGALHALEPGHGKTIVAAYLVGSKGTARHAVLLGLIVTASHTAGVFALGAVTLYASRHIVPEQLYPWLNALSGIAIACLGGYMFLRRVTGTASDHSHTPGSVHSHWMFWKRRAAEAPAADMCAMESASRSVSLGQLFTLGITGGIVPCPAALVVLLSAFALHRIALGFLLIVAFSAGLAATLICFGVAMVYARHAMARLRIDGPLTTRWLPAASSAFIAILGLTLTIQAVTGAKINFPALSATNVGPFLFVVGLGLVLGMRHSTDADHVVAISTIVSQRGGVRNAALIGCVWGLGHTLTIFAVGALIILFGVEIPPRIGLSMEFCVALMLVLLGVLNLTGVLGRITAKLTRRPADPAPTAEAWARGIPFLQSFSSLGKFQFMRPLVIGLVHGLAGSAAVALLVLSTIHDPVWATAYLLIFGGGTMLGMMLMTTAISVPLAAAGSRSAKLSRYFGVASGVVSLCFGSFLVYQLGFLGGLFTANPHWTPQ